MPSKAGDEPLHYYKWHYRDFRANRKVQRMSWQARGLYRDLLDEFWDVGPLANDLEVLADICSCPVAVLAEFWPEIKPCWEEADGLLTNAKMDAQRTEKDRQRVANRQNGASGGKAKAANAKQPLANASPTLASGREPKALASNPSSVGETLASVGHIEEKRREEKRREEEQQRHARAVVVAGAIASEGPKLESQQEMSQEERERRFPKVCAIERAAAERAKAEADQPAKPKPERTPEQQATIRQIIASLDDPKSWGEDRARQERKETGVRQEQFTEEVKSAGEITASGYPISLNPPTPRKENLPEPEPPDGLQADESREVSSLDQGEVGRAAPSPDPSRLLLKAPTTAIPAVLPFAGEDWPEHIRTDDAVRALLEAHPRPGFGHLAQAAVVEQVGRLAGQRGHGAYEAYTYLLGRVKAYAKAVASWPAGERQFIAGVVNFLGDETYRQDEAIWRRDGSFSGSGGGDSEAIRRAREDGRIVPFDQRPVLNMDPEHIRKLREGLRRGARRFAH